jgi:hypothetical protein
MLLAHLGRPAPRLSSLVAGVTRELDAFVLGLLAKKPSARPPTALAAAEALRTVARRYRGLAELEAATPAAGYAVTTRIFSLPLASEAGSGDDAPTLIRAREGTPSDDTVIDHPTADTTPSGAVSARPAGGGRTEPSQLPAPPQVGETTNTCVRITSAPREPARAEAPLLRGGLLWGALWITLAGAGLGLAALGVLVTLLG